MDAEIFYFSGTGNSYIVARDLAERIGAALLPIASRAGGAPVPVRGDAAGLVFPVYYGDLPGAVRRFAARLDARADTWLFAVGTYGGGLGDSMLTLRRILQSRSRTLSAAFGVHMTQNAFRKPWEDPVKLDRKWKRTLETVGARILQRREGMPLPNRVREWMIAPIYRAFQPATRRYLEKLSDAPPGLTIEELIHRSDAGFATNEACTGCGTCARVCPVDNIRIEDGKPVWLHRCENCIACYNWCPRQAVASPIAWKGCYYRHPGVSAGDIMGQKRG